MNMQFIRALLFSLAALLSATAQAAPLCSVGDSGKVLWKGEWFPATVVKVNETQTRCFIRYTGYDSSWDEWVGADRYRAANAGAAYKVGDAVAVKWKGQWYPASVLQVRDGRYKIHYDQYDSSWDEWVGPNRIRRK